MLQLDRLGLGLDNCLALVCLCLVLTSLWCHPKHALRLLWATSNFHVFHYSVVLFDQCKNMEFTFIANEAINTCKKKQTLN